jgi:hypothetical protein
MGNQETKKNTTATTTATKPATAKPEVQNEETISGYLRDVVRNVKGASKANAALDLLGNDPELAPAKAALTARKEKLAKAAAQRVYEYILNCDK